MLRIPINFQRWRVFFPERWPFLLETQLNKFPPSKPGTPSRPTEPPEALGRTLRGCGNVLVAVDCCDLDLDRGAGRAPLGRKPVGFGGLFGVGFFFGGSFGFCDEKWEENGGKFEEEMQVCGHLQKPVIRTSRGPLCTQNSHLWVEIHVKNHSFWVFALIRRRKPCISYSFTLNIHVVRPYSPWK